MDSDFRSVRRIEDDSFVITIEAMPTGRLM
jgi:hypothetical protein